MSTAKAVYTVAKAAPAYRAIFDHLSEAVAVTLHCFMALAPSSGGSPQASLAEVVAKLARAKVPPAAPCSPLASSGLASELASLQAPPVLPSLMLAAGILQLSSG